MKRKELNGITPITLQDIPLYREFFEKDNRIACYGNSWYYITQACRGLGLGLKYYDEDVLVSIGQHRGHYVLVRPLGEIDNRFVKLLSQLRQSSGKPVFIKKLFSEQVAELKELSTFSSVASYCSREKKAYPGKYIWNEEHFADDDTYPELVFDVGISADLAAHSQQWLCQYKMFCIPSKSEQELRSIRKQFTEYRRRIRQFSRLDVCAFFRPYEIGMADSVRRFLLDYFGPNQRQNLAAYENMLAGEGLADCHQVFQLVAYTDDSESPVGFYCFEQLDEKSAGQYAGVADRRHPGLPEYLNLKIYDYLREAGFKLLNTGGAEVRSLDMYKRKPGVIEERYMQMLAYGFERE